MSSDPWYNAGNRRGARVADWGGLENRCGLRTTVGSNPTLSAGRKNPMVIETAHYRRLQSVEFFIGH